MRITILNGNPDYQNIFFDLYLADIKAALEARHHSVTLLRLRDLDIRYCIGCFDCWVKTPGECYSRDESSTVCRAVIHSDFTLWAAPLHMGFPSALLKKTMDKSIPLIHPYFEVVNWEAHHRRRYAHYPRLGLLVQPEAGTNEADLRIVADIFSRTALNMKSKLEFCAQTTQPAAEIVPLITSKKHSFVPFDPAPAATQGGQVRPPMKITAFNGSPRGSKGNTPIMLSKFLEGFASLPARSFEIFHLNHIKQTDQFTQAFAEAECVFLGFPLYTDGMPGLVKAFIETLETFCDRRNNPPIGFLVQSGFPETRHSRHVERYLERLAARLGSPYLGTIAKGSCEGVHLMPEQANRKLFDKLGQLGKTFGEQGLLDPAVLHDLAQPENFPAYTALVFAINSLAGKGNGYWDYQLKQNGVFEKRFAKPYMD